MRETLEQKNCVPVYRYLRFRYIGTKNTGEGAEDVHPLAAGLRARVVRAGVPEDHVDSMVAERAAGLLAERFVGHAEIAPQLGCMGNLRNC